ncbi:MAG TPA: hypothetical protein DCL21_02625, partial [Alphaproteobacteria bacterium]|nr:hypothetical protein [Alphaproteobacteria bacterium]
QLFNYAYVDDASSMEEKLRGYQLLKDFNEYKGEDYFHGTVDSDIKLEFAEVETKLKHGSNAYNYFNGGVVLLTMPFKFDSHTVVKANSLISKIEGSTKLKTEYEFDTVDINNATLSKYFTVMSNDKHGAFYLLSPSFIKRLVGASVRFHELFNEEFSLISPDFKKRIEKNKKDGIEDEMNTATLEIEFKDNKVLILIRGQYDFLAPADLHTTVYCTKRLAVIEQQLNLIADLAKQLKLDYLTDRKQAYNKIEEN